MTVKVFGLLQTLSSVDGVGEGVGVVVSDLLRLGDLPHRPHRAHPGPVDGDLGVLGLQLQLIIAVRGKRPRRLTPSPLLISKAFTSNIQLQLIF